jgi:transcriptional regulator GlxA family with amidase domain
VGKDEDPIIGKVHRYVTEHITDVLSIEQLASAASVSRRTLSRAFAKHAKVTPSVFVEQVRVDTARKFLEDTDDPLKTIAFNCGFRSAAHMRTTFSRRLNVTPKQYRQRFRAETNPPQTSPIGTRQDIEPARERVMRIPPRRPDAERFASGALRIAS